MTSQKLKITITVIIASSLVLLAVFNLNPSCSMTYLEIMEDIKKYETTFDPEHCDSIMEKISKFEDRCSEIIEPLDCG